MKKIIVTGHGHYATGLKSTIELLAGKNNDVYFIDFLEEDSDATLKQKFEAIIQENQESEILFFCDLVGGTPYKTAVILAYENKGMEVVAGCNVGALLDAVLTKENFGITELAEHVISVSQSSMGRFEKTSVGEHEDAFSDGI